MKVIRQRRASVGIDMSPLIDCVFQLLVFFMLSSTFLIPVVQLKLPTARTEDPSDPPSIVISINREGNCFVDDALMPVESLKSELEERLDRTAEKSLTIRADEKTPYSSFVRVLDIARMAGAVRINIAHEPSEQ